MKLHETCGTGAIREIPPTTTDGRITALECKLKECERNQREQEFQIKTLAEMLDRLLAQVVGEKQ